LLGHKLSRQGKRGSEQKNSIDTMVIDSCKIRGGKA
jgi:hypothetical protein